MVLARHQFTVTDDEGNALPGATVTVRSELAGNPIAALYSNRAGNIAIGNPFTADADGFAAFHVLGGAYWIEVTSGAFSKSWRYVAIGLAAESDTLLSGITYAFSSATADADPGAGFIRFNNASLASVTTLYLDEIDAAGGTISGWLDSFDDGGSAGDRGAIALQTADGGGFLIGRVTGSVIDGTGYRKISVTVLSSGGAFTDLEPVLVSFSRSAINGVDGVTAGVPFNFSSTTTMADPGAGIFRLNNATLSSVTAAAIDDQSAATGNPDVSAFVLAWDDSTTTTNRGFLIIKKLSAPQNFVIYRITGASTDNAGWTQLALTYVTHAGSFTNADPCSIEFAMTGAANVGKQTIWIPASAMYKTNAAAGPSTGQLSVVASTINYLAFDPATTEDAFASIAMPKSWDLGAITFKFHWTHPATSTNFTVAWTAYAKSYGDNEAIDGASFAGGTIINDTGGTTSNLYISAEGNSLTPAGTPAANDLVNFIFRRLGADASDNLAVDAYLLGVQIYYTTNAVNDA